MRSLKFVFVLLLAFASYTAKAQESELELAEYYYSQGLFEQANLYYEKIYKTNKTNRVYTNYLNTLIALNNFEEAEKLAKKKIKEDGKDGVGYVKLGDLYKKFDKPEDSIWVSNKIICVTDGDSKSTFTSNPWARYLSYHLPLFYYKNIKEKKIQSNLKLFTQVKEN